jgi:hypothetical protein
VEWLKLFDSLSPPTLIDVPRQPVVQFVIGGGNVVEHLFHLLRFPAIVIGLYFFLLVHWFLQFSDS